MNCMVHDCIHYDNIEAFIKYELTEIEQNKLDYGLPYTNVYIICKINGLKSCHVVLFHMFRCRQMCSRRFT